MTKAEIIQKNCSFWNHLSDKQKEQILINSTIKEYSPGNHIHAGSNDCIGLIILEKGRLRNYLLSEDGREITLFRLEKGESCALSASCILDEITFDIYIDAEVSSEVLTVSSSYFQQLASENIYVENFMYKTVNSRFSQVIWIMEQVLFMSMDKRLAIFLINEGPIIRMTHEQIARHMGTAREVVSRMLKYFAQERYVKISRGNIEVTNKKALLELI